MKLRKAKIAGGKLVQSKDGDSRCLRCPGPPALSWLIAADCQLELLPAGALRLARTMPGAAKVIEYRLPGLGINPFKASTHS